MSSPAPHATIVDGPEGPELRLTRRIRSTPDELRAALREPVDDGLDLSLPRIRYEFEEEGEVTVLVALLDLADDDPAEVGPELEFALDRFVTVLDGGDVRGVQYPDYVPAMQGYYASLDRPPLDRP